MWPAVLNDESVNSSRSQLLVCSWNVPAGFTTRCIVMAIIKWLLHFWHTALGVHSTKFNCQSPERTILKPCQLLHSWRGYWIVFIQVGRWSHPVRQDLTSSSLTSWPWRCHHTNSSETTKLSYVNLIRQNITYLNVMSRSVPRPRPWSNTEIRKRRTTQ